MRVYSVSGVPPEIQAYAMAKYSRSSQGMLESITELSDDKAASFLETFYFQYGHRSIADLAHLVLAIEDISILAAVTVADEQLWDGQERSTRYQDFTKSSYVLPDAEPAVRDRCAASLDALFAAYNLLARSLTDTLVARVAKPAAMDDIYFRRTLRARAFDVARGLLPLATRTSIGQIVSARVLEQQVSRLLADPQPEIRALGAALKDAAIRPAEAPLHPPLAAPAAPTLVKYTAPDQFGPALLALARAALNSLPADSDRADGRVALVDIADPVDAAICSLLFHADHSGRSLSAIAAHVRSWASERKRGFFAEALALRGPHDDLSRHFRASQPLLAAFTIDIGALRDLHRHRRCQQFIQPWTDAHGYLSGEEALRLGLGDAADAALDAGIHREYDDAIESALDARREVATHDPLAADYLLPMAVKARALFAMDWAQAAYIAEQRYAPAGHFSYRWAAWELAEAMRQQHPAMASIIRGVDSPPELDLLQR